MEPLSQSNITSFSANPDSSTINRKLAVRWGGQESLFARPEGWVGVPDAFLRLYARLKPYSLTVGEAMFVLELMSYKWSANAPFPSYKSLAARMGVTDKMVRRYAAHLQAKGYLRREARIGSTNTFDLNPLFTALAAALEEEKKLPQAA
ncbi:MAG: helix-turn-helix domain-containing protein [Bdellovibrionales bacterium]|nr:helix-turn-helix domain-containing protein [Bdellovibrionales bacterium]